MSSGRRFLPRARHGLLAALAILIAGFLLPEDLQIPVEGAGTADWNHATFWHAPWGKSGVHKGIDIFAPEGRAVRAATGGLVVYRGRLGIGGRVVVVLGPKWRLHYYAHLGDGNERNDLFVAAGDVLGRVGSSGNARGKPPHLHYAILSLVPFPWRWDSAPQGWKKMFYLDPSARLLAASP